MAQFGDVLRGDVLVANDMRYPGKRVKIEAIVTIDREHYAVYRAGRRIARVRFDFIFLPGQRKSWGWTLERREG